MPGIAHLRVQLVQSARVFCGRGLAPRCGFELPGSPTCAVYCGWRHRMATESLAEVVRSLTPLEQDAVRQFIDYLKRRDASVRSQSTFLQAADEFIAQHPELLQRQIGRAHV